MKVTASAFDYCTAPYGKVAHIPAGIPVELANNLPLDSAGNSHYWVSPWVGMDDKAKSWHDNYGFVVEESQVIETPFCTGQRVRILPGNHYFGKMQYGIIQAATRCPGMCLINEDRTNIDGEWAFLIASYRSPQAGALWMSAKGLEPMKRPVKK